MSNAVFIGRFQPFHNGHLHDVQVISKIHKQIFLIIGSAQEKNTIVNPFTYKERKEMISNTLKKYKIGNVKIMASKDLYDDKKWVSDISKKVKNFDFIYSGNKWTLRCFERHKKKVKEIELIKGLSSTKVREFMIHDQNWEKLVPKEIGDYVKNIHGVIRIKKIFAENMR